MINWGPDEPVEDGSEDRASWLWGVAYAAVATALLGTITGPFWVPVVQHMLGK